MAWVEMSMNSMRRRWIAAVSLPALIIPACAIARTWHILNNGSGDALTVQAGIDSAAVGDTVLVGPGTYLENLSIVGKDLVLKSELGLEVTVLDGSSRQESVIYLSGQTRAMVVEGFTITGGIGSLVGSIVVGGGLLLTDGASPVIRNNTIMRNGVARVTDFGGGIVTYTLTSPASPRIEGNSFDQNGADLGGAVSVGRGNVELVSNIFRQNACLGDGGAIYAVFNSGSVTIEGNQFWDNSAGDHGGGIHIGGTEVSEARVAWNLFVGNRADGLARDHVAGGAIRFARVRGAIVNNTIVENTGPTWNGCAGGGLSLQTVPQGLEVAGNIIALNSSCGLTCEFGTENTLGSNLFWMNGGGELRLGSGACPSEWMASQIFADPMFCAPEVGNYTVAVNSPALTGPVAMGVWTTPGCGPGVPTRPTTWGHLKALYR